MSDWKAHVWVKWDKGYKNGDWSWVEKLPNVDRAWTTMGDWDCCLEVDIDKPGDLENFVWKNLKQNDWVSDTHSTWSKEVWGRA